MRSARPIGCARRSGVIMPAAAIRMIRPLRFISLGLLAVALLFATGARAQLTIEIIGGGGTTIPVAIVPFAGEPTYPYPLSEIVAADLNRSGLFKLVDPSGVNPRPARAEDVRVG